jgi:PAS domain S-box-containing protein
MILSETQMCMDYQAKSRKQLIDELKELNRKYDQLKFSYKKDPSQRALADDKLLKQTELLSAFNEYSVVLAETENNRIYDFIVSEFKRHFDLKAALISVFDEKLSSSVLAASTFSFEETSKIDHLLGMKFNGYQSVIDQDAYLKITKSEILHGSSLRKVSFGLFPEPACVAIEDLLDICQFQGTPLIEQGTLMGVLIIAYGKENVAPDCDFFNVLSQFTSKLLMRKQIEKNLLVSEEKFRKAFIMSPDSININRLSDGMYVSINKGFTKISGYSEEEVLGKTSLDLNIWADPAERDRFVRVLREKGEVENFETRFRMKSGLILDGIMSATIIYLDGLPHILSITRDITQRKQIEDNLKRSELRYRELIEMAPNGILLGSHEGIITAANGNILKITGRTTDELIGSNITTLFSDDELNKVPLRYDLLNKNMTVTNKRLVRRADNSVVPIEMHSMMMPDGTYQSFIQDISERVKAEETLRENERLLRETQIIARLGSFVWDIHSGFWKSSSILDEIFGIDENYIRSFDGWRNIVHPDWGDIMTDYVNYEILQKHNKFDKIYQIIRKSDSQIRWVHGLGELEFGSEGVPKKLIGTIMDVTDRKNAEEEITKLNSSLEERVTERTAQLEAANSELQAFAYSVSHDLRAPLRAIDGFSRFVLEDYGAQIDPEGKRLLGLIRSNTHKMDKLITDILALSRVSRSEHKKSRIDMTKMAFSMYNETVSSGNQERLKINIDQLPDIYADPAYIKQVWINLISNAVKFSSMKEKPEIKISGYGEEGYNVYSVSDNGVGFNPEYTNKLFGVFQRLHKGSEFEGNGVGLAIVQRIVQRHGGSVWAEGQEGEGATFYFRLPSGNDSNS